MKTHCGSWLYTYVKASSAEAMANKIATASSSSVLVSIGSVVIHPSNIAHIEIYEVVEESIPKKETSVLSSLAGENKILLELGYVIAHVLDDHYGIILLTYSTRLLTMCIFGEFC